MQTSSPIWVSLTVGFLVLLGALGSQLISALVNLKTKRLELSFGRKADAYRDFMIKAGTFGHDPRNEEKYLQYLHSYLAALIVASDNVKETLNAKDGVSVNAQRLRVSLNYDSMSTLRSTSWSNAMEAATIAMRDDLQQLSKH
ncbi:MAG: hypothetical protein ACR2IB_03485 [Pyrinomonadaceae bacterium]